MMLQGKIPLRKNEDFCDVILIQNFRGSCSLFHPRDYMNADNWFSL